MERASANSEFYPVAIRFHASNWMEWTRKVTAWARSCTPLRTGPFAMAMKICRYFGPLMSDPDTTYRKCDDIKTVRESCAYILCYKRCLLELSATEDEVTVVEDPMRTAWLKSM